MKLARVWKDESSRASVLFLFSASRVPSELAPKEPPAPEVERDLRLDRERLPAPDVERQPGAVDPRDD